MMRTLLSSITPGAPIPRWACGLLAATLLASTAHAQSFQGGLRGTVKDAQGVIPGATVTMTNQQNNTVRETQTNGQGEYSFPAVEPSTYTIKATVPGYKTFERKGILINV